MRVVRVESVELEDSQHATQKRGFREKERSVEWRDDANMVDVCEGRGYCYLDIGCKRWQRFRFHAADFFRVVEAMVAVLSFEQLTALNTFIADRISSERKSQAAKIKLQKKSIESEKKQCFKILVQRDVLSHEKRALEREVKKLEKELRKYRK